jgi:hypothetical protein
VQVGDNAFRAEGAHAQASQRGRGVLGVPAKSSPPMLCSVVASPASPTTAWAASRCTPTAVGSLPPAARHARTRSPRRRRFRPRPARRACARRSQRPPTPRGPAISTVPRSRPVARDRVRRRARGHCAPDEQHARAGVDPARQHGRHLGDDLPSANTRSEVRCGRAVCPPDRSAAPRPCRRRR